MWMITLNVFWVSYSMGLRVHCVGQIEKMPEGSSAVRLTLSLPFFLTTYTFNQSSVITLLQFQSRFSILCKFLRKLD